MLPFFRKGLFDGGVCNCGCFFVQMVECASIWAGGGGGGRYLYWQLKYFTKDVYVEDVLCIPVFAGEG